MESFIKKASARPSAKHREAAAPSLLTLWKEDWLAHNREWTRPGFRAVAVHRFGVWRMSIRSKLVRAPFSVLYRILFHRIRNHYGIELPYTTEVGRGVVFEHQGTVVIHGDCQIGDGSIIRQGVTMGNRTLDRPREAPRLGRHVNVGAGAKLLGNIYVGDGAVIGANAVVLDDVPAAATAVGIPARIIPLSDSSNATAHVEISESIEHRCEERRHGVEHS